MYSKNGKKNCCTCFSRSIKSFPLRQNTIRTFSTYIMCSVSFDSVSISYVICMYKKSYFCKTYEF